MKKLLVINSFACCAARHLFYNEMHATLGLSNITQSSLSMLVNNIGPADEVIDADNSTVLSCIVCHFCSKLNNCL